MDGFGTGKDISLFDYRLCGLAIKRHGSTTDSAITRPDIFD